MEMFISKIIKYGNSIGVTIKTDVVKYLGVKEGDSIKFYIKKIKNRGNEICQKKQEEGRKAKRIK